MKYAQILLDGKSARITKLMLFTLSFVLAIGMIAVITQPTVMARVYELSFATMDPNIPGSWNDRVQKALN
ncbi:MAG: hypothetical protein ABIM21_01790, partial [candidate division WOR-3 bacterium]